MPFGTSWQTLLDECDALDNEATLVTPFTETEFRITDVQEHRIVITETETDDAQPLQREQFATLADRVEEAKCEKLHRLDRRLQEADPGDWDG